MFSSKTNRFGFSLLELLLVVGVGGVLILAGLGAYRLVSEGSSTNRTIQQLSLLKQAVQQVYISEPTYGTVNASLVPNLTLANALPSDMGASGVDTIRNAFGTDTTITVGPFNARQFRIGFQNVPSSACIQLAQTYRTSNSNDLVFYTIANTNYYGNHSLAATRNACTAASTVNMAWVFK